MFLLFPSLRAFFKMRGNLFPTILLYHSVRKDADKQHKKTMAKVLKAKKYKYKVIVTLTLSQIFQ